MTESLGGMLNDGGNAFLQVGCEHVQPARNLFEDTHHRIIHVLRDGYGFPMGLRVECRKRPC